MTTTNPSQVREVMSDNVVPCHPEGTLADVIQVMEEHDCGIVPITDARTGKPLGVVTDRDACFAARRKDDPVSEIPVADAMTDGLVTARLDEGIDAAHAKMREHRVRRIPVVDDAGKLAGLISLGDLCRSAATARGEHAMLEQKAEVANTSSAICEPTEGAAGDSR